MGKSTISMAIFNSYVSLPEGTFLSDSNDLIRCSRMSTCIMYLYSYHHLLITQRISQILDTSLWLFKVAIGNCPFIDGLPGFTY